MINEIRGDCSQGGNISFFAIDVKGGGGTPKKEQYQKRESMRRKRSTFSNYACVFGVSINTEGGEC